MQLHSTYPGENMLRDAVPTEVMSIVSFKDHLI